MKGSQIFLFIFVMWILIIAGCVLLVTVSESIKIQGYLTLEPPLFYSSIVKAIIAIAFVAIWIYVLSKIKNWIFRRQIKH